MHYLDHAATTPVPQAVAQAMLEVLTKDFGNPSSQYELGRAARARLEADRAVIAGTLGCRPEQLFFTSCGTEGDNWAIRAALYQNRRVGKHIVTTAVEHSAVLACVKRLEQEGYMASYIKPDGQGRVSAEQVLSAVREDTALVSVMLVNNETGARFPVEEIAAGLEGRPALLHTDAVQGFLKVPFTVKSLGADYVAVSGHKLGGPKGIGALYIGG
ncbi:MAG: aminotransferase class V-fold PLP-dependent enzyme, partial [Oscillospiraceae bacterium]|nr:aminotransferase class V-fold PLP-dependent enzyme [Oscillospiraceae bacterium]